MDRLAHAYIHILEAEVADVRARLAEYEHMFDIRFENVFGPDGEPGHMITTACNRRFSISSVHVRLSRPNGTLARDAKLRDANDTMALWLNIQPMGNHPITVVLRGYNGWAEISCSMPMPGRFVYIDVDGYMQYMTTRNAEYIVRKIVENFPFTIDT